MSAKYFLLTGWKTILRLLKKLLKTEILLLSIQPANRDLDVLLSFQEVVHFSLLVMDYYFDLESNDEKQCSWVASILIHLQKIA